MKLFYVSDIQNSLGIAAPTGSTINLLLSQNATTIAGAFPLAQTPIVISLDDTGSASVDIWFNDELNPSGTNYLVTVVTPNLGVVWSQNIAITGASFNLGAFVPGLNPSQVTGVILPTFEINGTPNINQSTLNLVAGANITVTEDAEGDITITGSGTVGVSSVFGRTGAITAESTDYSADYDALGTAASLVSAETSRAESAEATVQSNAETFATNAVATETSRAETAESTAQTNAESFSTAAILVEKNRAETAEALAQSTAETFATTSIATALTTAETFATSAASTAQSNSEAFTTASVATETTRAENAESLLAPLASAALTGSPTAPTKSPLTDSTDIATTAYTDAAVAVELARAESAESLKANLISPAFTGTPTAPTKTALTNNQDLATTAYTDSAVAVETTRAESAESLLAPKASPTFTGTVSGITATMVGADASGAAATAQSTAETFATSAVATETSRAETAEALLAPKASPTFTGTVSGITASMVGADASGLAATETSRAEAAEALLAPKASPTFTGTVSGITASMVGADASGLAATETTRAEAAEALLAPKASPTFTGVPIAPTATALTSSTQIATTAYSDSAVGVEKSSRLAAEALLLTNPMTALGDIIYENATPAPARLAGNSTTTKKFLNETGGYAVPAFVQTNSALVTGSGTNTSAAFTSNNTLGNMIFVSVSWYSGPVQTATISDTLGNTYTAVSTPLAFYSGQGGIQAFYCFNCKAGANTVKVTLSGAGTFLGISIGEYSGVNTIDLSPVPVNATSSALSSGAFTTAKASELLIAYGASDTVQTVTAGTGWTNPSPSANFGSVQASQVVSSTGSYTATFTASASVLWGCGIASFYGTIASAPSWGTLALSDIPSGITIPVVQTLDVSTFAGADLGAKINAAIAVAPSAGCVLDLRNLASPQTLSTAVNITGPFQILGDGLVVNQSAAITLTSNNSAVLGVQGRAFTFNKAANLTEQILIVGNDCVIDNVVLNGSIASAYTGSGIILSSGATRTIISNTSVKSQYSYGIQNQGSTDALVSASYIDANGVNGYYESADSVRTRFSNCQFVDASTSTGALILTANGSVFMNQCSVLASSANIAIDTSVGGTNPFAMQNCVVTQSGGYPAFKHGSHSYINNCTLSGGGTGGPCINVNGSSNFYLTGSNVTGLGVNDCIYFNGASQNTIVSGNYLNQTFTTSNHAVVHVAGEILGILIENNTCYMNMVSPSGACYGVWCQYTGTDHFSGMRITNNTIVGQANAYSTGIFWDNTNASANAIGNLMDKNFGVDIGTNWIQVYDTTGYLQGIISNNHSYGGGYSVTGGSGVMWDQSQDTFTLATVPSFGQFSITNLTSATPTTPVRTGASGSTLAAYVGGNWCSLVNPTVKQVNLTSITSAITYYYPYVVTNAGEYLFTWNAKLTTAGSSSSTMGPLYLTYTDPDGTTITTYCTAMTPISGTTPNFVTESTANTVGTVLMGLPVLLNCGAGTNIGISWGMSSSTAGSAACNLNIVIEIR